jgi:hypothetical protein
MTASISDPGVECMETQKSPRPHMMSLPETSSILDFV